MNAVDELRSYIENRGEQMISLGNGQYMHDHMLPAILEDIEREYVELPKDADGVPCKIGDLVDCDDGDFTIDGLKLWNGEWWVFHENGLQNKAASCQIGRASCRERV